MSDTPDPGADRPPEGVNPPAARPVGEATGHHTDEDTDSDSDNDNDRPAEAIRNAAAAALARAREAARAAGLRPTVSGRVARRRRPVDEPPRSAEGRDPVLLGAQLGRLVADRGWEADVAVGSVVARWPAVIGPQVAQHVTPESFEDGVLTVRADSTSWATQLRYMVPTLLERLAAEVGEGVVADLKVVGPAGRSWRHGRRTAPGGRGPRDTYG